MLIQIGRSNNERPDVCGPCGGECCKRGPGTSLPEDFGDTPRIRLENLRAAILSRRFIVVALPPAQHDAIHADGKFVMFRKAAFPSQLTYVRPRTTDETGIYGTPDGSVCSLLGPSGCSLTWEERPSGCRALVPNVKDPGKCGYTASLLTNREWGAFTREYHAARAWRPYWKFLRRTMRELAHVEPNEPGGERLASKKTAGLLAREHEKNRSTTTGLNKMQTNDRNAFPPYAAPHDYDINGSGECRNGCGAYMHDFSSGGPEGVDPFGDCPRFKGNFTPVQYGYSPAPPDAVWRRQDRYYASHAPSRSRSQVRRPTSPGVMHVKYNGITIMLDETATKKPHWEDGKLVVEYQNGVKVVLWSDVVEHIQSMPGSKGRREGLEHELQLCVAAGLEPGLYKRGDLWRVHLQVAANVWEDVPSLESAAEWLKAKREKYVRGDLLVRRAAGG